MKSVLFETQLTPPATIQTCSRSGCSKQCGSDLSVVAVEPDLVLIRLNRHAANVLTSAESLGLTKVRRSQLVPACPNHLAIAVRMSRS
jgi:hypothetical protein